MLASSRTVTINVAETVIVQARSVTNAITRDITGVKSVQYYDYRLLRSDLLVIVNLQRPYKTSSRESGWGHKQRRCVTDYIISFIIVFLVTGNLLSDQKASWASSLRPVLYPEDISAV